MKGGPLEDFVGMIDFSFSSLASGLIFGAVGLWMFREGKRLEKTHAIFIGVALMIYPYFTKGPAADWGVGFCLCGLAYYLWDS
jgi:dolichol kinase